MKRTFKLVRTMRCESTRWCVGLVALLMTVGIVGCKDLTGGQPLPAGTQDPASYATPSGARGMYTAAMYHFTMALPLYVTNSGLLTDELIDRRSSLANGGGLTGSALLAATVANAFDARILPLDAYSDRNDYQYSVVYGYLQGVRTLANQAIGALAAYDTVATDTASARVMRGELYAVEGYTEIMLADLFCSGVPLSTLDFEQDYTLRGPSTTTQVYHDALAKLDTALALAAGNDSVMNFARVGRGRAWLDLGQFDSAAAAVQTVAVDFHYIIQGNWYGICVDVGNCGSATQQNILALGSEVSNREGLNGLPYISSGDPRTMVFPDSFVQGTKYYPQPLPVKYEASLTSTSAPIVVASGIEAQLIRAEAALQASDVSTWLSILNTLRTSGTADSVTWIDTVGITPPVYGDSGRLVSQRADTMYNTAHTSITRVDTIDTYRRPLWRAGSGGVSGLYPISDPGTAEARIDTLFTERATWLFITGHRQGDLRRLLREYNSYAAFDDQSKVYPTGLYTASRAGVYGSDVDAPIPQTEYTNPLFHGCLNRGA